MRDAATAHPHSEHFATERQHRRAVVLGMWLFLATEVMMFGGLFMGVIVYRIAESNAMATASRHLDLWLGGANTAVLLASSACVAMAVVAARCGLRSHTVGWLAATAGLGLAFLAIKAREYRAEYEEGLMPQIGPAFPLEPPATEMFFNLYFAATGLHALHLAIGIVLVAAVTTGIALDRLPLPGRRLTVETVGLYWHFVDLVWVFLYPVFYLAGR